MMALVYAVSDWLTVGAVSITVAAQSPIHTGFQQVIVKYLVV